MTDWRDLDGVRQPLPLDDWTADRLLAGLVDPDDAPPGYAGLAQALGEARGPAEAGELAGRDRIVAAVAAAVAEASPPTTVPMLPRRKPMLFRLLGTKVAAATVTTVLLATGAAAATGSLPGGVQDAVTDVADRVGVTLPVGDAEDATPASSQGKDAHETRDARAAERDAAKAARDEAKAEDEAGDEAGDDAGDSQDPVEVVVDEDLTGAEHGIGKGDPTSDAGIAAHEARDTHLQEVADRQAEHKADPAGEPADEDSGTPAAEQGAEAHAERDARLAELDEAKAAREAEKAQRPADEGDEAGDDADDDSDDDADEDGKDEHEDDESEDEAPADPAV